MQQERRRAGPRREVRVQARLGIVANALPVETVNVTPRGVLVRAKGRISVLLNYHGKPLRGRLVRVTPEQGDNATFAIQLDDPLPY